MRASKGLTFQGGTSTGQTVQDLCSVSNAARRAAGAAGARGRRQRSRLHAVQWPPFSPAWRPDSTCHLASGFLTQFRGLSSYQVPKVDVEVSATFQSKPGAQLAANYNIPAATIAQSLGRAPSGGVANVTVNIVTPGSLYGDRVNELDLRFSKVLRFGSTRTKISLDLYNALNANPVLTYNQTYSPTADDVAHADVGACGTSDEDRRVVRFLSTKDTKSFSLHEGHEGRTGWTVSPSCAFPPILPIAFSPLS